MDFLYDSYISWFQFALVAGLIYVIYFLVNRFKSIVTWVTGLHNLSLINSLLLILLVIAFIMINPFVHGIIVVVALVLFFQVLTSYIKGMIVTTNSKIEVGDLIKVAGYKGKVSEMSLAGIKLLNEKNNLFIPYKIIANKPIEKFKSDQSSYLILRCAPTEEIKAKSVTHDLEKVVFNFPFLEHNSNIEVRQIGEEFEIHLTIVNDKFKSSLFSQLKKAGFTIINNTNETI